MGIKLFKFFGQTSDSHNINKSGMGLGLTISNMIIQQLGGEIEVESLPGAGSRFFFSIPLTEKEDEEVKPTGESILPLIEVQSESKDLTQKESPKNAIYGKPQNSRLVQSRLQSDDCDYSFSGNEEEKTHVINQYQLSGANSLIGPPKSSSFSQNYRRLIPNTFSVNLNQQLIGRERIILLT